MPKGVRYRRRRWDGTRLSRRLNASIAWTTIIRKPVRMWNMPCGTTRRMPTPMWKKKQFICRREMTSTTWVTNGVRRTTTGICWWNMPLQRKTYCSWQWNKWRTNIEMREGLRLWEEHLWVLHYWYCHFLQWWCCWWDLLPQLDGLTEKMCIFANF